MILGSIDIVPHQDLLNPLFGGDDDDEHAWGDLPYACDAPYSQNISDFTKPTRVIGRLPDIQAMKNTAYFVKLLDNAAKWVSLAPSSYDDYFAVSALTWQKSTKLSVKKTFGSNEKVFVSPTAGPPWNAPDLAPLAHFINCHGNSGRSAFYGEDPNATGEAKYPIAHQTIHVRNFIEPGTVAAVECCFGAELYKPHADIDPEHGICQEYLYDDAYGFFGATTIAYGPAVGHGAADIICAAFLKHVRAGDSLGLAALAARQDFIKACDVMDPIDLKTLGQFNLLGDPSIHPVHAAAKATGKTLAAAKKSPEALNTARAEQPALDDGYRQRREDLRASAARVAGKVSMASTHVPDPLMDSRARAAAQAAGITPSDVKTFELQRPTNAPRRKAMAGMKAVMAPPAPARICVVTGRTSDQQPPAAHQVPAKGKGVTKGKDGGHPGPSPFVVAVMKERLDGSMTMVRKVFSK